ncbi:MAG: RdgB/HAM1 family non-canonical purine NTP pyrophosphatase [Erysipelotrichaceae bacterium]|nr:RdgB/HAM1 family non-canonical purine NTP pyrophosphatase [Erysipelotrichaceae bacterium]MDY5251312.1 RdgB/HAM1 family non-canonical purine NTP pyrophosphatase [Erysipelotrichaceae bacterium]
MEIFIATANEHKVAEFKAMLAPLGYQIKSLNDLPEKIEIEENGQSFEENALIKARAIAEKFGIVAISDDSGLEIDALDKQPGIYSARFLGYDTPYEQKNQQILQMMKDKDDRTCRFVCAMAICYPDGQNHVVKGTIEGYVADQIEGPNGFGYDPIFYYPPFKTTLANVDPSLKNSVSHRHNALVALLEHLNESK